MTSSKVPSPNTGTARPLSEWWLCCKLSGFPKTSRNAGNELYPFCTSISNATVNTSDIEKGGDNMSSSLIVVLCVLAVLVISLIIWWVKHKGRSQARDLERVEEVDDQGRLSHVFHHIDGVKNGLELFYYGDGKLNKEKHWVEDRLEGEAVTYFENGEKYIIANYNNGLLHGDYFVYGTDGKVMQRYTYDSGKRIER